MLGGAAGSSMALLAPGARGAASPWSHTLLPACLPASRGKGSEEVLPQSPLEACPPKYLGFEEMPVTGTDGASQTFHLQLVVSDVEEITAATT